MHESEKWKWSHSVVSDSSRPHGLRITRLLRPWDFPGKSTGVGCHCLLCSFSLHLCLYTFLLSQSIILERVDTWENLPSTHLLLPGLPVWDPLHSWDSKSRTQLSDYAGIPCHAELCPTLCDPWTAAHQAPLSMTFSRQECWSGLPFPSP